MDQNKPFLICLILLSTLGVSFFSSPFKDVQTDSFAEGKTLILYDAAAGAVPSESFMDFIDFPPGAAFVTFSEAATVLDTTLSSTDTYAGWVSGQATTAGFPILDRAAGFLVNFTLQVESEMHGRDTRSGFSLIVLDQDAMGIEISFWENEIWAQNDEQTGGLFTHGESIGFATTTGVTSYQLSILGDTYTLFADSQPLLSGPVRDYSGFDGFPDPYQTPNFLFLGDNTTSSQARIRLGFLSVTGTEPLQSAITNTSISIGSPTASFTPLPSVTPIPSSTPVPNGEVPALCPSGWLLIAVTLTGFILLRTTNR
jgi:hypothetical protein